MQKDIFIIKGKSGEEYVDFSERMFSLADRVLSQSFPETLKLTLTLNSPGRLSVIPFRRSKAAVFSVTGNGFSLPAFIPETEGYTGHYMVEEAVPVAYAKDWPDGDPTPGVCLLTLFHKKPGLDHETFLQRWHNSHTPLSLKLHPLWNYNRNAVTGTGRSSVPYDGIVEEQFRTAADLLNPIRFFGPPVKVPLHMLMVYRDTVSFLDMKRIEPYLAVEYHLKS
jgi:hypothetical protein